MYLLTVLVDAWSSRVMPAMICPALRFFQANRILLAQLRVSYRATISPALRKACGWYPQLRGEGFPYGKNLSDVYG